MCPSQQYILAKDKSSLPRSSDNTPPIYYPLICLQTWLENFVDSHSHMGKQQISLLKNSFIRQKATFQQAVVLTKTVSLLFLFQETENFLSFQGMRRGRAHGLVMHHVNLSREEVLGRATAKEKKGEKNSKFQE